jgi:hypothetical protein
MGSGAITPRLGGDLAGITGNYLFFFLKVCNSGYFWLMIAVDTPDSPWLMQPGRKSTLGKD